MAEDDDERMPSWHTQLEPVERPSEQDLVRGGYADKARRLFAAALSTKSPSTIRAYENAVKAFAKYMGISSHTEALGYLLSLDRLDAELRVLEFMGHMEANELSSSTIRSRLAGLKFYVRTAYRAQWVDWTLETEGPPQETVKDVEGPTPEQFERILEIADNLPGQTATRNRLLVYMLAFMGLRINECLSLDLEHVDFKKGTVSVLRKGKRRKRETRTVPKITLRVMKRWVKERGSHQGPFFTNFDLNPDSQGKRLSHSTAYRFVRKLGEKAGVPGLHPHAFRHFSATEALELTDGNTRKAMKHTGHTSENVFNMYEDKRQDVAGDIAQQIETRWKPDG
jgi:integrase/recombinase XerC